jgi:uncharacterized DUF497 family protein
MFAPREFEWDEAKATSNEAKQRISFSFAIAVSATSGGSISMPCERKTESSAERWSG